MSTNLATIRRSRQAKEEADFEAYEYQRIRTDEVTEASEKLTAPMLNTFDYEIGKDGELYFEGQCLDEVFEEGLAVAKTLAEDNPDFGVEYTRRCIEYDEYLMMRDMAANPDAPEIMVVLSPIPDAVVQGYVDLNAYDLERNKTLVRVFERTDHGMKATSLSLDLSDRDGLGAIAETLGETIADDDSSEDILFKTMWTDHWQFGPDQPVAKQLRRIYDKVLEDKHGGTWLGGRQDIKQIEALQFIEQQTDLVDEHMVVLRDLKTNHTSIDQLERARHNFAAGLTRRLRGEVDVSSLSDAGAIASSRGETYSGDCATGVNAAQSTEALGFTKGFCRVCLEPSKVGGCSVCLMCENADNAGEDLNAIHAAALKNHVKIYSSSARASRPEHQPTPVVSKAELIKQRFGQFAVVKTQTTIGGADKLVVDKRTGQVIFKL